MIFKIELGRVRYQKSYLVSGQIRVPARRCSRPDQTLKKLANVSRQLLTLCSSSIDGQNLISSPRKEIETLRFYTLLMTDVIIDGQIYFSDPGKRSRQTEGIWDPVWGPKVEHFRPRRFQNPFKIILKHLVSKRRGHNVKRTTIYPLEIWTPRGFPGLQESQESSQRRPTGQNMNRFKLGAWSRVSK